MKLTVLQYNHRNDPMFCAPNSLYLQINSMINSYINPDVFKQTICLDDIARNIGFNKSMGSGITSERLSKLSNRINRLINKDKLNVPKSTLKLLDNNALFKKLDKIKENKIFTVCISFEEYYKFLEKHNALPEYYKNSEKIENSYLQHCFTLIAQVLNKAIKYIILDPNIELGNKNMTIDINQIQQKYNDKTILLNLDNLKTILTMRYDSMDDDRIIVDMEFESNSSLDIY